MEINFSFCNTDFNTHDKKEKKIEYNSLLSELWQHLMNTHLSRVNTAIIKQTTQNMHFWIPQGVLVLVFVVIS